MVNYDEWRFWFDVAQMAATAAIGIFVWWDRYNNKTSEKITDLEDAVNEHAVNITAMARTVEKKEAAWEKRMAHINKLERDLGQVPSRQELCDLTHQISLLTEKVGTMDGRLKGISRAVDLLTDHHLSGER